MSTFLLTSCGSDDQGQSSTTSSPSTEEVAKTSTAEESAEMAPEAIATPAIEKNGETPTLVIDHEQVFEEEDQKIAAIKDKLREDNHEKVKDQAYQDALDQLRKLEAELNRYLQREEQERIDQEKEGLIINSLPNKINVAKTVQSLFCQNIPCDFANRVARFCDQSLATKTQVDNYRSLLTMRNPDLPEDQIESILRAHIKMTQNRCAYLTYKESDQFEIMTSGSNTMLLFVESCPGLERNSLMQFSCATTSYLVTQGPQQIRLTAKDKVILLPSGKPINAVDSFPYTSIGPDQHFWLEPHSVPAQRDLLITQEYLGNYSHTNTYALDFGMQTGEDVASTKTGVVVTNNLGSNVFCNKVDSFFQIFKDDKRVNSAGEECASCSYASFPDLCHSRNSANRVLIQHVDNTYSSYMHLQKSNPHTQFGDVVKTGEKIGKIGISGWVDGAHLHLEIQQMNVKAKKPTFQSIPVHFKTKYGAPIYPNKNRSYLRVPMTAEEIQAWKEEWHGTQIIVDNIPADSTNFDCQTRFAAITEAPNDCLFKITGSSYWPAGYTEENIERYANRRAQKGEACLKELLGSDISTELYSSIAPAPQSLASEAQKSFRKIAVDISCF